MKRTILVFTLLLPLFAIAQIIPGSVRVDWSHAGLEGNSPSFSTVIDVSTFGAVANDTIDDHHAVDSAIASLNNLSGVIYFPAGNYILHSGITLPDSVIIRGAGADSTTLTFDFGGAPGNSFDISSVQSNLFQPIATGYQKDSRRIVVSNAQASLRSGDDIEIREANGAWDIQPAAWAVYAVGHFSIVDSVRVDTLWLHEALRIDMDSALHPEIRKVTRTTMCGFECFKMTRTDINSTGLNYGFNFAGATHCWLRGVESQRSIGAHVAIDGCSHISVTGCYFHDAYLYDGTSTRGYGVMIISHSTSNLIEDNIFKHLRHAMITKQGANGNVFGYNYSIEPNRSEPIPDYAADMCLHGHYAFANLYEGNIGQNLQIDIVWGPSGPFNTFFRNKLELYGIVMSSGSVQSDRQNFVGNDVSSTQFLQGNYSLAGSGHFQSGNNVGGTITPGGAGSLADTSYYLGAVPPFFWNIPHTLPAVGIPNTYASDNNPARQRYMNGGVMTRCEYIPYIDTTTTGIDTRVAYSLSIISCVADQSNILTTISSDHEMAADISLINVSGQLLIRQKTTLPEGVSRQAMAVSSLPAGIYFLLVKTSEKELVRKVLVLE